MINQTDSWHVCQGIVSSAYNHAGYQLALPGATTPPRCNTALFAMRPSPPIRHPSIAFYPQPFGWFGATTLARHNLNFKDQSSATSCAP